MHGHLNIKITEEIFLCRKRLNDYYFVWRQAAEHSVVPKHKRISDSKKETWEDYGNTVFWSVQALGYIFHKDKYKISLSGLLVNWKYLSQNKAILHHLTQAHVVVITQWTQTDAGWQKKGKLQHSHKWRPNNYCAVLRAITELMFHVWDVLYDQRHQSERARVYGWRESFLQQVVQYVCLSLKIW